MSVESFRAIAFDFGNTLCPWGEEQYRLVTSAGLSYICSLGNSHCAEEAQAIFAKHRDEDSASNLPRLRENDLVRMLSKTAYDILGRSLKPPELSDLVHVHTEAFVSVCRVFPGVEAMLSRLSKTYRLALLSNYPLPDCIRRSLAHLGIAEFFDVTLVSGDLGVIKPGRRIFGELLDKLELPPQVVLFVGDDWVADIVGAYASGLPSIHIESRNGRTKQGLMDGVFGTYLRRALEMPELSGWENAKPLAVLDCVVEVEQWLDGARRVSTT